MPYTDIQISRSWSDTHFCIYQTLANHIHTLPSTDEPPTEHAGFPQFKLNMTECMRLFIKPASQWITNNKHIVLKMGYFAKKTCMAKAIRGQDNGNTEFNLLFP